MDIDQLLEMVKKLDRKYLDKETFEKARESIPSMAEGIANTLRFLDGEIVRLRSKRMKLPFDTLELNEMQKTQARNELLLKEYLASLEA